MFYREIKEKRNRSGQALSCGQTTPVPAPVAPQGVRWCESRMVTKRTGGLAPAEGGRSQLARGGDTLRHPDEEPSCSPATHTCTRVCSKGLVLQDQMRASEGTGGAPIHYLASP